MKKKLQLWWSKKKGGVGNLKTKGDSGGEIN